jgi:hypothetical protein
MQRTEEGSIRGTLKKITSKPKKVFVCVCA